MGYRSEVGLCLSSESNQKLDAALIAAEATESAAHMAEIKSMFEWAEMSTHVETGAVAYTWDGVKWYEDFPAIRFIENLLLTLDGQYLFIRVGEDYEDTEIQGNYWNNPLGMTLSRAVVFG